MHLKRLTAPKSWTLNRKEYKWTARPLPGPHKLSRCITLNIILKDLIKHAKTTKEVKDILNNGNILVNNVIRKDYRFPVGIMDVLEIPKLSEHYRVMYGKNGYFILKKISDNESKIRLGKIVKKMMIKGKRQQVTLHDGGNIILARDKDKYAVGDTLVIDTASKKIIDHIQLEKGNLVYLIDGKHIGEVGIVVDVINFKNVQKPRVAFKIGDKVFETLKDYAFVIGKKQPIITV